MSIKLQLPRLTELRPRITVIGVGGAGGNAINNMIASNITGVEFVVANTDAQALSMSSAEHRIQLGINLTEGLGAGSKPEIGEAAAEEAIDDIRQQLSGSHMCFIAAGMGGGTGTGAAAVVARVAKELDILTVAIVTKPFHFEGTRRMRVAQAGIEELRKYVDTLIVIPNQNLFRIANEKTTFAEAFVLADQVLQSGVACIVDLIVREGLINLDFADVRTVMTSMGSAMMGTGQASGDRRALQAAEEAIHNPLLDDVSLKGARGLLLSITGSKDLTLYEVDEAATRVRQEVDPEATIIVGATFDETLTDTVRVSIVASGIARPGELGAMRESAEAGAPESRLRAATPPSAARPGAHGTGDPLHRRLSEALRPNGEAAHAAGVEVTSDMEAPLDLGAAEAMAADRDVWHGPGDVTIVEQSWGPQTGGHGSAPGHSAHGGFVPQPPIEERPGGRRMPELQDFPVVGQRDYAAKTRTVQEPASPQRRPGFFERWTGARGRRAGESDAPDSRAGQWQRAPAPAPGPPRTTEGAAHPPLDWEHPAPVTPPTADARPRPPLPQGAAARGGQPIDLPQFFKKSQK